MGSHWFLFIGAFGEYFVVPMFHLLFFLPGVCWNLTRFIASSNCDGTTNHELDWIDTSESFSKHVWPFRPMVSLGHMPQSYHICSSIVWITMPMMNIFNWHSVDWKGKGLEMFGENKVRDHDVLAPLGSFDWPEIVLVLDALTSPKKLVFAIQNSWSKKHGHISKWTPSKFHQLTDSASSPFFGEIFMVPYFILTSNIWAFCSLAPGRLQRAGCGTFTCWCNACRGCRSCRGGMDIWGIHEKGYKYLQIIELRGRDK